MKKQFLRTLLLIGVFCVSFTLVSAETVTGERHSLEQLQEISIDNVDVGLQVVIVPLIAFGRTTEMLPLNEAEVEISYGNLSKVATGLTDKDNHYIRNVIEAKQTHQLKIIDLTYLDGKALKQQKLKCIRDDLKKSGTDTYVTHIDVNFDTEMTLNKDNLIYEVEYRIRGIPTSTQNI